MKAFGQLQVEGGRVRASAGGRVSRFYERCQALGCKALGVCASLTTGRARDRQSRWATAMTQARRLASRGTGPTRRETFVGTPEWEIRRMP